MRIEQCFQFLNTCEGVSGSGRSISSHVSTADADVDADSIAEYTAFIHQLSLYVFLHVSSIFY